MPNDYGAVRVPEHDDVRGVSRKDQFRRRAAQFVPVADVQRQRADRENALARQRGIVPVGPVAPPRFPGRDASKRGQDGRPTDIAGVDDEVDPRERLRDFRTQQPVRV